MVTVKCAGPAFDGQAEHAAARAREEIRRRVAGMGEILAGSALMASIRHGGAGETPAFHGARYPGRALRSVTTTDRSRIYQTGKYTMPVVVNRDEIVVTSDLASYSPWLEGTGSRNLTTRFKGYHSYRRAGQTLDGLAEGIAEDTIQPYIREMN